MTARVTALLERIKELDLFETHPLYFVGGTALAYYLKHRISEDIDIICANPLPYREISKSLSTLGASQHQDAHAMHLRLAGLVPQEHMLKFDLLGIKVEFFAASAPVQKEILKAASPKPYKGGKFQILDPHSIAKLKLIALLNRKKSRDLFDLKSILESGTLTIDQIISVASKMKKQIDSFKAFYNFIEKLESPADDEIVYLDENDPKPLCWDEIRKELLSLLRSKKFAL